MKEKHITLSITNPCSEDWNSFTPTLTGGFCSTCSKNVIDFTNKSDEEIMNFMLHKPAQTCGRFREDQIKVYKQYVSSGRSNKLKWIPAGMLGMLLLFQNKPGQAQSKPAKVKTEINDVEQGVDTKQRESSQGYIVKGIVVDKDNKEVLPGINVVLKGTMTGTVTDIDGKFTFPGKLMEGDILIFSFIGYSSKEYKVSKSVSEVIEIPKLELSCDITGLLGGVAIDEVYTTKPSGLKNFWGKIKRIF